MSKKINIIHAIVIFFTVILIGSAIGCGEPEVRLTTLDELRGQDIDTLVLQPAALKVIPGRDWLTDSVGAIEQYGFYLLNQDFTNTRETIISSDTLLAWLRDSISGDIQTLTYSNDSIYISGGNAIVITGFADTTEVNEVVDYINNLLAPAVQANIDDISDLQDSITTHRTGISLNAAGIDVLTDSIAAHRSDIDGISSPWTNSVNYARSIRGLSIENANDRSVLLYPQGSYHEAPGNPSIGAIEVKFPATAGTGDMVQGEIDVYIWEDNRSFRVVFAGYLTSNTAWSKCQAMVFGNTESDMYTVRFGDNGTQAIIWIGELNTSWSFPQINLKEIEATFSATYSDWGGPYSISMESVAFDNVDQVITNTSIYSDPSADAITFNPVLTFNNNTYYNSYTAAADVTFTVDATRAKYGGFTVARINFGGGHDVIFSGSGWDTAQRYNVTDGETLTGLHTIYFEYTPYGVAVSIPTNAP